MALKSIQTANLDTIRETGAYVVMDLINGPEAGPHLIQVTEMNAGGTRRVVQVVHALSSGAIRARMNNGAGGGWEAWTSLGGAGLPGADGNTVLNGSAVPTTEGVDGDFYIRTGVWTIYGPKASGLWGSPTTLIGPQGITGADGADGSTILNGSVAPTTQGVDGDFYIRTSDWTIYGPKTGGSWGSATALTGPTGADGKTVLNGTAAPTTEGVDGDFYIRTSNWTIYGPKTGGAWGSATSIIGPQGDAGADGADGKTVLNGASDPTTQGVDGDFYINTTSDTIFGPKTSGSWGSGTSLVGPTGPQGPSVPVRPQGRLTGNSAEPVYTGSGGSATLYYLPYIGEHVPLYDGSSWTMTNIGASVSQAASDTTKSPAAAAANKVYDIFIWSDSGTVRISRGPAWTTNTSRDIGAGSSELERVDGILMNKYSITNGPAAQRGVFLGTVGTDGSSNFKNSEVFRGIWNMYNRVTFSLQYLQTTGSWTYGTNTWRQANADSANQVTVVAGFEHDAVHVEYRSLASNSTSTTRNPRVGIGINSTTAPGVGTFMESLGVSNATGRLNALYAGPTFEGRTDYAALEKGHGADTQTFYGVVSGEGQWGITGWCIQ